jgi:ubiquinol oxidase
VDIWKSPLQRGRYTVGLEAVDLAKEQQATKARPRYEYSGAARVFFSSMDMLAGAETKLYKVKLIEALAPVPYHSWENREYGRLKRHAGDEMLIEEAQEIMDWSRAAKDNEYWHLRVVTEKIKEEGQHRPLYQTVPLPSLMTASYNAMTWTMARLGIRRAFLLNAEFEDHAEHTYAELIDEHPEWEEQPVTSPVVQEYGSFSSWADVFRRIGLDERDHMNASFRFAGRPEHVVKYEGMPE